MLKRWFGLALWKRVMIGLFFGLIVGLSLHYGLGTTTIQSVVNGQSVAQKLTGPRRVLPKPDSGHGVMPLFD